MKVRPHIYSFFFCNYFYGICAVALSIEASLQQRYPLNPFYFYAGIFCMTIWFYTKAYVSSKPIPGYNQRTIWYNSNRTFVTYSQFIMLSVVALTGFYSVYHHGLIIVHINLLQWILIVVFPLTAALYYGIIGSLNLRNIGWLKPFWIGFIWAGISNVYPVLFYDITHSLATQVSFINILLFFKNFMFVTVLCIMFDIKDYADDYNRQLKTFVVENGLRRTIFYILLPLSIAGLGSFLLYSITHGFSTMKILLNTIPFVCMILVAYSMHKRKSILYYLILIDGLMLLKALCGSIAMIFF